MKNLLSFIFGLTVLTLYSCNSNDDITNNGLEGTGITITDDVDCCSAEEALQVYKFLQTVKIIPELSIVVDGKYNVFAYSKSGSLHKGFNDIYFVATKKETGNYIKNFNLKDITPLMHMVKMDMYHSTPASEGVESFNDAYLAVKRGWISFLMETSEAGTWQLSYTAEVLGKTATLDNADINIAALPEGQEWLKSFKIDNATYFISLANAEDLKTGTNTLKAYISRKGDDITKHYPLATEKFTVDIVPTMPDMGNHTSPDNSPLLQQEDGSYQGTLNLTMTGLWRIHLTVKDSGGNIVAGGDELSDGFSSLYLDITI